MELRPPSPPPSEKQTQTQVSSPSKMADDTPNAAPFFNVPDREVTAVEHPMIIRNLDNAIKTFGNNRPFLRVLDSADPEECIPLYLRYKDPMCVPVLSHNSPSNNVLLKITVPKRTGRKRKRGSDESFTYPNGQTLPSDGNEDAPCDEDVEVLSKYRMDKPAAILRKIRDNRDNYQVEAVAEIRQSHRYRGLSDFHQSTKNTPFLAKFQSQFLAGDVKNLREFKFDPSQGWKPNEELVPPPKFTFHAVPQNWGWRQNHNIFTETDQAGKQILVNRSKPRKTRVPYLHHAIESIPEVSPFENPDSPKMQEMISLLKEQLEKRPVWSRRALLNQIPETRTTYLFKAALQYVGYQFKGGPFRDALIKYGVDPRKNNKYRKYQTMFFQLFSEEERGPGRAWHESHTTYSFSKQGGKMDAKNGHLFDGKSVTLDGKVWQLCDVTDPLLLPLINDSPYRDSFENDADGWYTNGTMAKLRAIMRTKIMALRQGKEVRDEDFSITLEIPAIVEGRTSGHIQVPVPDIAPTEAELKDQKQKGMTNTVLGGGIRKKAHKGKQRSLRIRKKINPNRAVPTGPGSKERRARAKGKKPAGTKKATKGKSNVDNLLMLRDDYVATPGIVDKDEDDEEEEEEEDEDDINEEESDLERSEDDDDIEADTFGGDSSLRPLQGKSVQFAAGSGPGYATPSGARPSPRTNAGTATVNGIRYNPAPIDLSMYKNIAPRPLAPRSIAPRPPVA